MDVEELIRPYFDPVKWGLFTHYDLIQFGTSLKTNINVNAGDYKSKGICYLASTHQSSGDSTSFEFGIIRMGYNGGHATKYAIKSSDSEIITISVSEDGFLEVAKKGIASRIHILFWG